MPSRLFKRHRREIIFAGCGLLVIFLQRPAFFLNLIQLDRYREQIQSANQSIGLGTTIIIIPFFVILYLFRKTEMDEDVYNTALFFTFANLAFSFLGYFAAPASRLSNMYFLLL